jgi:hypothetical protein
VVVKNTSEDACFHQFLWSMVSDPTGLNMSCAREVLVHTGKLILHNRLSPTI